MRLSISFILTCCLLAQSALFATTFDVAGSEHAFDYIHRYKNIAVREMQRTGIPASITMAQGMFESQFGKSYLAEQGNNHFGIKCKSDWQGETVTYDDDLKQECFKKYATVYDSYIDHSNLLKSRTWYNFLFLLPANDYESWAKGLYKAGYATDSLYAEKIVDLIERFGLYELDQQKNEPVTIDGEQILTKKEPSENNTINKHQTQNPNADAPKPTTNKKHEIVQSDLSALNEAVGGANTHRNDNTRYNLSGAPVIAVEPEKIEATINRKNANSNPQNYHPTSEPINNEPVPTAQKIATPNTEAIALVSDNPNNNKQNAANTKQQTSQMDELLSNMADTPSQNTTPQSPFKMVSYTATSAAAAVPTAIAKSAPVLSHIDSRKIATYSRSVSLGEVSAEFDIPISLLKKYNEIKNNDAVIPAQTPVFLQASLPTF